MLILFIYRLIAPEHLFGEVAKRCKDPELVGKVKEVIHQVSHSKKWMSEKAIDEKGNLILNSKGKQVYHASYSVLQDKFFEYMQEAGYGGFSLGEHGNSMMGGINQSVSVAPSPIPTSTYHIAVNGQATGPFDISTLSQMAKSGQITADSLVWKNRMAEWRKAGTVDELKYIFTVMPPIPPNN